MTDWQAIGTDPCTAYSLFHNPQLINYYRAHLKNSNISEVFAKVENHHSNWCSPQVGNSLYANHSNVIDKQLTTTCNRVSSCESNRKYSPTVLFQAYYNDEPNGEVCFNHVVWNTRRVQISTVLCTTEHNSTSSCFMFENNMYGNKSAAIDKSLLASVHVQSLQVVEEMVYQMAVNRCESAGDHCHWIPNSQVTHKHCSDCQPICRDTRHTLNFVQFIIGLTFFFSTCTLLYTGAFLLLSDCVSKSYQV